MRALVKHIKNEVKHIKNKATKMVRLYKNRYAKKARKDKTNKYVPLDFVSHTPTSNVDSTLSIIVYSIIYSPYKYDRPNAMAK